MQSNLFVSNLINAFKKRIDGAVHHADTKACLNWWKVKYLKHASPGKKRAYKYDGRNIYYASPIELLHTLREIFVHEIYKAQLPQNAFIVDCGANIGLGVLYFKEHHPKAEILAFEPDESNYLLLAENVKSFELENVTIRKEAVWIADTELSFHSDGSMGAKIELNSATGKKVKAIRLKSALNRKIDFLKIDIEGAEYEVIKDLQDALINVDNMFLEYHGSFEQNSQLTELFNILTAAGFNYYIKEAANIYDNPFLAQAINKRTDFDVQLNIFCFRK